MKIKKWYLVISVTFVLIALYFLFGREKAIPVKEIPIKHLKVKRTVSAAGTMSSENDADLSFALLGKISDINVEKGEDVAQGKYLSMLENFVESETTQSLKDTRDVAQRDLDLFIENYASNLDGAGGLDEYNIQVRRYQELLSKAEAAYQAQLGNFGKTYLYAPFSGKIIDIYKNEGETVSAGTPVLKIADTDKMIFEIELDQEDFAFIEEGQEVEVTLDAFENEIFTGMVKKLPDYVATDNGGDFILEIILKSENRDKVLLGMTGDAFIILSRTDSEVSALTFDEIDYDIQEKPFVYVEENGKIVREYLELGLRGDIYIEIKNKNDKPVVQVSNAKYKLEEGLKVKIVR